MADSVTTVACLIIGIITFLGIVGIGRCSCRLMALEIGDPYEETLFALTGVLILSLIVEVISLTCMVSFIVWALIWLILALIGISEGWMYLKRLKKLRWRNLIRDPVVILLVISNAISIAIALAPSSKSDELHYHMLVPLRLLSDGYLRFYRYPWESAILPQMHYQLIQVLLHSINFPDAANVTSFCFGVLLQCLIGKAIVQTGASPALGTAGAAAVSVGLIPIVWHVAAGAHALSNLASAALVLMASPKMVGVGLKNQSPWEQVKVCSIVAIAAVETKVILIPLVVVCLSFIIARAWRHRPLEQRSAICLAISIFGPWIVFYGPLAAFTFFASGSPFGPIGANWIAQSVYNPGETATIFIHVKQRNQQSAITFLLYCFASYSPAVWFAALSLLVVPTSSALRWYWTIVTITTCSVLFCFAHNDIRFVAGYPYAALPLFAACEPTWWAYLARRRNAIAMAAAVLTLPWMFGMAYYATPFIRCTLGFQSRENFALRYTAFRDDFKRLDKVLPSDAVLLITGIRLNSANSPRPVFFDIRDLPADCRPFLFEVNGAAAKLGDYSTSDVVYVNQVAVIKTFRQPGMAPVTGSLRVLVMQPSMVRD